MTTSILSRIAAVKLQDKDPFPDISNAIKNAYHSLVNATDSEGAEELARDTVHAVREEFEHLLTYGIQRIDQELGGKSFQAISFTKIADTHQYTPRDDSAGMDFCSAEAVFPTQVVSKVGFPLDIEQLVKAALPEISENTEIPVESVAKVIFKETILEKLPDVLEQVSTRTTRKQPVQGNKLSAVAEQFAAQRGSIKVITSTGDEVPSSLRLTNTGTERFVEFTNNRYVVKTVFSFNGEIVWGESSS